MNLGDYIGDTRTESLPPGFLKSIKIKYRHEASHVFPRAGPCSRENQHFDQTKTPPEENGNVEQSEEVSAEMQKEKETSNLMKWRVPSRLLNQQQEKVQATDVSTRKRSAQLTITRNGTSMTRQSTAPVFRTRNSNGSICSRGNKTESGMHNAMVKRPGDNGIDRVQTLSHSKRGINKVNLESEVGEKRSEKVVKSGSPGQNEKKTDADGLDNNGVLLSSNSEHSSKRSHIAKENTRLLSSRSLKQSSNSGKRGDKKGQNLIADGSSQSMQNHKGFPKLDMSLSSSGHKSPKDENKGEMLPQLKSKKEGISIPHMRRETPKKLPSSPERIHKINAWMSESTKRERKAAFDLLSSFITNEKVQASKPKRDRILIALQALERKRTPSSIKPLRIEGLTKNLAAITLGQEDTSNKIKHHRTKRSTKELKTWHHMPVYHGSNAENKSAMFVQPWKFYGNHFSIHPEWGLHKPVSFAYT